MKDIPSWDINGRNFTFWRTGYEVGCGGHEVPMEYGRKHYLYVWNKEDSKHEYFCFEDDLFIDYKDAPWIVPVVIGGKEYKPYIKPDVIAES